MRVTVERNWIWAFAAAFVFLVAMMLTTCAKAASYHHRHHRHHHHYYHHRHHRTTTRATTTGSRHGSRYYHRRYASTQTRHHRSRSTPRVMAAASRELSGPSSNRLVTAMRSHLGGNPTGWSHNWCAHYLDMELRATGHRGGGNLARGYARYGVPCAPQPGAIAVMPHHVGVVMSVGPGYVLLVSGNHGHRVGIGRYSRSRIIAYRMPA